MSFKFLDRRESLIFRPLEPVEEIEEKVRDEEDTACGIGSFHPPWLQKFSSPKAFLINNGLLGLMNGLTFTYFIGCISTLEKRFTFETQVTGIIMISEELCPFFLGYLIGYFGSQSHRPRFIAISMTLSVLSSFVMASPYFYYGAIRDSSKLEQYSNRTDFELCGTPQKDICDKNPTLPAVSLFFIGLCMKGLGNLAFYIVGTTYLDDNIKKKNSALYFAILMTLQLMGPALGFLLSSLCLSFYEDPFYDPGYGPEDPRWIGAWWMGFIIIGAIMSLLTLPVWLYPRSFPGTKLPEEPQKNEEDSKSFFEHLKNMKTIFIRLYKNPILIFSQLGSIMRINGIEGLYILIPKYLEMQFKLTASKANLLTGPLLIVLMQVGIMAGGIVVSRYRPTARVLTGGIVFTQAFTTISLIVCMLITCPSFEMTGTSSITDPQFNLENDCNRDCLCTTTTYTPICGPDGKSTYFSPCYAGCTEFNKTYDKQIYTDCKCVHDDFGQVMKGNAVDSYCGSECQWLIGYIVILGFGQLIFCTQGVPNTLVTFRCVDPADKTIALGAVTALYSVLAYFPYPLLYGALTDSSCLVWEESCGKTGNCWIYDVNDFRYKLHGASVTFLTLGCFFDICVWFFSSRLKNLYDDGIDNSKATGHELQHIAKSATNGESIKISQRETETKHNDAFEEDKV